MKWLFVFSFCSLTFIAKSQVSDSVDYAHIKLISEADSLIANYKFEKALNLLAKGDTLIIDILLRIGQCHSRLGASAAAIYPYERILKMDSANLSALNQLGQLYARDGDFEKAYSTFAQLIKLDPTNSYYYKQAGSIASRLEDKTSAKKLYRKALSLNPADIESSLALGNVLMELEEYESADTVAQQALAIEPGFEPMLLLSAKSAFEQQHYESVIIAVNSLLESSDTTALYARLLGISYFHQKEHEKLMTCMTYLLKNRYDFEWIYYYMGVSSRELGGVTSSLRWFRMAAEKSISENTKTYYSELGKSYELLGDYQGAIRAYRAAYNYSKDGILLYHLARNYDVYYKDKKLALEYYEKYLESDDTIRLAREYARKRMQDMGKF